MESEQFKNIGSVKVDVYKSSNDKYLFYYINMIPKIYVFVKCYYLFYRLNFLYVLI